MTEPTKTPRNALISPIFIALQFLTLIPPLIRREMSDRELGLAVGWFPLVGMIVGGVMIAADWLLEVIFPIEIVVIMLLAIWLMQSGALHFDGWLDALDGLFGGRTPESRLEIMKDERVGAFGLTGGVLLLLLKWKALSISFSFTALLIAPILGRWAMVVVIVLFPYGREYGLGKVMKDEAGWGQVLLATLLAAPIAYGLLGWAGFALMGIVLIAVFLLGWFTMTRIPGLTGDIYGAICELSETLVLLALVTRWMHG